MSSHKRKTRRRRSSNTAPSPAVYDVVCVAVCVLSGFLAFRLHPTAGYLHPAVPRLPSPSPSSFSSTPAPSHSPAPSPSPEQTHAFVSSPPPAYTAPLEYLSPDYHPDCTSPAASRGLAELARAAGYTVDARALTDGAWTISREVGVREVERAMSGQKYDGHQECADQCCQAQQNDGYAQQRYGEPQHHPAPIPPFSLLYGARGCPARGCVLSRRTSTCPSYSRETGRESRGLPRCGTRSAASYATLRGMTRGTTRRRRSWRRRCRRSRHTPPCRSRGRMRLSLRHTRAAAPPSAF
ncbi:hypothetical protein DFH06DRAFT_685874 [Mycena polygramma]|nr:hypothetical protein DFH06DRAFT_685874 [Mycena polygramma]